SLFHFVALLPALVGPVAFPFVLIGAWKSVAEARRQKGTKARRHEGTKGGTRQEGSSEFTDPSNPSPSLRASVPSCLSASRFQLLIAAIPFGILAVHSLLYCLGRMASNGELRYLLIVAPFWALLAAQGWEWAF